MITHFKNHALQYLLVFIVYILPIVINIYLFRDGEMFPVETNEDLFAIGVLTTVPIVNWFPIGITFFKMIGRLIVS